MEVGERYIIEISDVIATNNGNIAKIKGFNALVFDENGLDKLEKAESYYNPDEVNEERKISFGNGKSVGYSEGYDKGFKDGVKHQESMIPPKAEPNKPKPHEPQIGDIYKSKSDGTKVVITYNDMGMYMVLLPDGDNSYYDADEFNKYYEFVENRADVLEPIKGALA